MPQGPDRARRLFAGIDKFLPKRTDDTVSSGIHFSDLATLLAGRFDNPTGTGVDDGGNTAGLSIKDILWKHFPWLRAG